MSARRLALLCALTAALGCGGNTAAGLPIDEAAEARVANPDGVAYPTEGVARPARMRTTTRAGDRVPNLTFRGYKDGDRGPGLQALSLADYYDPGGTRVKVIHLMAAAGWCSVCQGQTRQMTREMAALKREGLVSVQALIHGPSQGKGPTLGELDGWLDRHAANFSVVADSNAARLFELSGPFEGVPWNAMIDARTMELLDAGDGAPQDFGAYARSVLGFVARTPPRD